MRVAHKAEREGKTTSTTPPPERFTVVLSGGDAGNIGYIKDEWVEAESADLKTGDAGAAWYADEDASVGRVIAHDDLTFTIRTGKGNDITYERSRVEFAGVVTKAVPRLDDKDLARITELRQQLEKLSGEDDQIIRCSERYRIEREIYDIEHPPNTDDWSAWEEKGEQAA